MKKKPIVIESKSALEQLQLITTLGYMALLTIGMAKEMLRYWMWDVNILSYSTLIDILLSPLEVVQEDAVIVIAPIVLLLIIDAIKQSACKLKKYRSLYRGWLKRWLFHCSTIQYNWRLIFLGYVGFVMGLGIGMAIGGTRKIQKKIKEGTIEMTHQVVFHDKEQVKVVMVGQNNRFVFYVVEGEQQLSVAPMDGNVKRIKKLPRVE